MAEPSRCTRRRSSVVFAYWRHRPGASERGSFAGERRQRNAPANVADEPRAGRQRGGVSPPNSSGTPDKGLLAGAAERIGSRRFANGSAVHRQTRRMEPPGYTRSEQSDVCESGGSSATLSNTKYEPLPNKLRDSRDGCSFGRAAQIRQEGMPLSTEATAKLQGKQHGPDRFGCA